MSESDESLEAALAKSSEHIISHMNLDHTDSCLVYAHYYAKLTDAVSAVMVGLTTDGFEFNVTLMNGTVKKKVLIPFETPLTDAKDVRKIAVSMHFAAYNGMGIQYKLQQGYYQKTAKQAWKHIPFNVKWCIVGGIVGVVALVLLKNKNSI
eukprot:472484_1